MSPRETASEFLGTVATKPAPRIESNPQNATAGDAASQKFAMDFADEAERLRQLYARLQGEAEAEPAGQWSEPPSERLEPAALQPETPRLGATLPSGPPSQGGDRAVTKALPLAPGGF